MAQRVEVILEDDIDGSPADETVRFALNGTSYEGLADLVFHHEHPHAAALSGGKLNKAAERTQRKDRRRAA